MTNARIAFGGMAATPKRAAQAEARCSTGQNGTKANVRASDGRARRRFPAAHRHARVERVPQQGGAQRAVALLPGNARRRSARPLRRECVRVRSAGATARTRRSSHEQDRQANRLPRARRMEPHGDRRRPAARIGDAARERRSNLHRRHPRIARHAARRARAVAACACAHRVARSRCGARGAGRRRRADRRRHPRREQLRPGAARRPDSRRRRRAVSRPAGVRGDRREPRSRAPRGGAREKRGRGALRAARSRAHAARSEGEKAVRAAAAASAARRPGREDRGGEAPDQRRIRSRRPGAVLSRRPGRVCDAEGTGRHARPQLDAASERDAARRRAHARLADAQRGVRMPAHGRRLRRQGIAVGGVRVRRGARGATAAPAGQAARRPRRRLHDHRQAPRRGLRIRSRLRRRRPHARRARRNRVAGGLFGGSVGRGRDARRLPLRQRVLPVRCRYRRAVLQDEHAVEHRVSRLRRSARRARDGSDARRASRIG